MADVIYNSFKGKIMDGSIDLDTDTIKVVLVTSSYTPNIDTHTQYSHITNQVTGTGYTAGGATLANKSVAVDTLTIGLSLTLMTPLGLVLVLQHEGQLFINMLIMRVALLILRL